MIAWWNVLWLAPLFMAVQLALPLLPWDAAGLSWFSGETADETFTQAACMTIGMVGGFLLRGVMSR